MTTPPSSPSSSPDWLNKGDNAWQLVAATLVGLQSMPGLVILYGSIVKKKWAINSAFMAIYAFAASLIVWVLIGYCIGLRRQAPAFLGQGRTGARPEVGPRLKSDRERFPPNNILLMIAGAGLLWMGWSGFNGGAPYAANIISSVAILNTNVSASASLLVWTCLDVLYFREAKVSVIVEPFRE
ncbi:hypothetical protein J5N97_006011 [Dioscorea zingiberensis]|uniref:Ammonium transporter AmtB-like domain-containing protein n=1 Tax=Dioscorea zingiberensis TaxID=325984 RepID=A0A9D5DBH6_9LILI|nr:hypothetical protein J5N97_006011 [Dioscorea zingiberensis]